MYFVFGEEGGGTGGSTWWVVITWFETHCAPHRSGSEPLLFNSTGFNES